ncbi:MAG: carbohydrate kinase family protein [Patescibacteria group bacterium]
MYDMITIGGIKLDTFILIPKATTYCQLKMPDCQLCIEYGKKHSVDDINLQIAGSAPNMAVGLSRMKQKTAVYSIMGQDIIFELAKEFLSKNGVDTEYIKAIKGRDSSFSAVLNYKGESTQLVSQNDSEFRLPEKLASTEWIHVSELGEGYKKLYKDIVRFSKKNKCKISFNPGVLQIQEKQKELFDLLKYTDVLFINKIEAQILLDAKEEETMQFMMGALKKLGPKFVVITDGKNGAFAYDGVQLDYVPMFPGKRVEATGAGDAFATGFLGALLHGKKHGEALRWGSVNAASVVGKIGPTKGLLSHTEIQKRLKARPSYKTKEL